MSTWADWAARRDDPDADPIAIGSRKDEYRVKTADGLVVVRTAGKAVYIADGVPADATNAVLRALGSAKLIP